MYGEPNTLLYLLSPWRYVWRSCVGYGATDSDGSQDWRIAGSDTMLDKVQKGEWRGVVTQHKPDASALKLRLSARVLAE
jgi:hypothetical protein